MRLRPIVSEQSSEQANSDGILGFSFQQVFHSPFHDLRNLGHIRGAERDLEGKTVKHRRVFRIIVTQSPPDCSESLDLDRSIAAISRRHGTVGNYGHTATTGATDDNVPDGVAAFGFEEVIQVVIGGARVKL